MNNRIPDLMKESTTNRQYETWNNDGFREVKYNIEFDYKKFAQLIIQECHDVIKSDMELKHIQMTPIDFKMYANNGLGKVIKEHFGIE
jgi:hypothetical protein